MEIFKLWGSVFLKDEDVNKKLDGVDKKAGGVGITLGGLASSCAKVGIAIGSVAVALATKGVMAAAEFQEGMANISTLLDGDVKTRISELGKNIKKLQTATGMSAQVLQEGLYQVISAFGDTADSAKILETASKGAAAGNATVTDSVNLLSAVTKGYGDTSSEAAQKASDLAFLTVKLGQTTFPELAASMGKVIPLAGSLKVSQEELFGAMATLTGVTGNTAEVSTQLRAVFQSLMKPSKDMQKSLESMGFSTGAAALESLGLQGVLSGLKESTNNNEVAFSNLFSSVEAGTAVLALTGTQAENFVNKSKAMQGAAGATESAFDKQQAAVTASFARIKEGINVVLVNLGEKFLPKVEQVVDWIVDHMPEIQKTIDDVLEKHVIPTIDKFAKAIGFVIDNANIIIPVIGVFGGALLAYEVITKAVKIATTAWTAVQWLLNAALNANPIGIVTILISALVAAIIYLWNTNEGFRDALISAWNAIKSVAETVFNGIKSAVETVIGAIGGIINTIGNALESIGVLNRTKVEDKSYTVTEKHQTIQSNFSSGTPGSGGYGGGGAYAEGTDYAAPGGAWVGERGPEYVEFRGGEKVIPNEKLGGITVNINNPVITDTRMIKKIAEGMVSQLHALGVNPA